MKIERLIIILFTVLGFVGGMASSWLGDLVLSVVVSLILYLVALIALYKFFDEKRRKWLIYNSLMTFILVWLVVWVSIYNLR